MGDAQDCQRVVYSMRLRLYIQLLDQGPAFGTGRLLSTQVFYHSPSVCVRQRTIVLALEEGIMLSPKTLLQRALVDVLDMVVQG